MGRGRVALAGIGALVTGTASSVLLIAGRRWIVPPRVVIEPPPSTAVEEVFFTSDDGTDLYGWFLAGEADAPGVVLCHGYHRSIEETFGLGYDLRERGFNALLFDFRGCGRSGGRFTTIGYHEPLDARGAVRWLERRLGQGRAIGVHGISMGGATALLAAADCPAIQAVVTDSAFSTLEGAVKHRFEPLRFPQLQLHHLSMRVAERLCGGRVAKVRPVDAARRLQHRPVLLIHGAEDAVVPPHHALDLYEALPGPRELWMVAGAAHAMARYHVRDEYLERVTAFFTRHLSPRAIVASV